MRTVALLGSCLVVSALLGGCTPQACDPSRADFFSGIGCEASGSYTTRNQYQQSALAQQNAAVLQNRAAAADEGARANDALISRDQARRRLASSDRETAQLRARLAAARARGGADQARLDEAQAEVAALQRQRAGLQNGATADQLREYEERHRRVMDSLTGI